MLSTLILVVVTFTYVLSVAYAGSNEKLIAELRARHLELNVSPFAGLLFLASSRWILAGLWVAYAVETGDSRYAAIGLVPVVCGTIQRAVTAPPDALPPGPIRALPRRRKPELSAPSRTTRTMASRPARR